MWTSQLNWIVLQAALEHGRRAEELFKEAKSSGALQMRNVRGRKRRPEDRLRFKDPWCGAFEKSVLASWLAPFSYSFIVCSLYLVWSDVLRTSLLFLCLTSSPFLVLDLGRGVCLSEVGEDLDELKKLDSGGPSSSDVQESFAGHSVEMKYL